MERIAVAMETFSFWVKIVVMACLAYLVLTMPFAAVVIVGSTLSGGTVSF